MQSIGFGEKNPSVYEVMTELDNHRNKNLGGASFNDFCQIVNNRIPERETTEDLRRVFSYFYMIIMLLLLLYNLLKKWLKNWEKILMNSNWEQC